MRQDFTIDRNKFKTDTGKKLYDMLKNLNIDDNFIISIMNNALGDKKRKQIIKYIEQGITEDCRLLEIAFFLSNKSI